MFVFSAARLVSSQYLLVLSQLCKCLLVRCLCYIRILVCKVFLVNITYYTAQHCRIVKWAQMHIESLTNSVSSADCVVLIGRQVMSTGSWVGADVHLCGPDPDTNKTQQTVTHDVMCLFAYHVSLIYQIITAWQQTPSSQSSWSQTMQCFNRYFSSLTIALRCHARLVNRIL